LPLFGPDFEPWVVMILPPGGFLTLGLLLAVFARWKAWRDHRRGGEDRELALRRAA
jgi:electron transport complex protein RnfE